MKKLEHSEEIIWVTTPSGDRYEVVGIHPAGPTLEELLLEFLLAHPPPQKGS